MSSRNEPSVQGHKGAYSGTVDKSHAGKVQHHVLRRLRKRVDLLAKLIEIPRIEIPIDIVFHQLHRYDPRAQLKVAQESIRNLNAIPRKLAARRENRRG